MSDLVKRLRKFANGCRGSMWQSRDETIRLMDEAATRIEALEAERDALAEKLARAVEAGGELSSIIEGIQGTFNHGTWRDEKNGMRLKDTGEWIRFYNALAAIKEGGT